MKFKTNFKILSPATITNIGLGSGVFGIALNVPQDEIIVKSYNKPGIHIPAIYNNKNKLSLKPAENTAGIAALEVINHLINNHGLDTQSGLELTITKKIPIGIGLGSAEACAAAGATAVNTAFGNQLSKHELLPLIIKAIKKIKPDFKTNSLIPSLFGGLILTRKNNSEYDFHRIPTPRALHIIIQYSRNKKLKKGPLINTNLNMQQLADTATFIHGLYTSNFKLISESLKDTSTETHWENQYPGFIKSKNTALDNSALNCNITGNGPGIFSLCKSSIDAENIGKALIALQAKTEKKSELIISTINQEGTTLT